MEQNVKANCCIFSLQKVSHQPLIAKKLLRPAADNNKHVRFPTNLFQINFRHYPIGLGTVQHTIC